MIPDGGSGRLTMVIRGNGMKILVLGGSSGIGKAVALRAARESHDVMVCGRDSDKLRKTGDDISALGQGSVKTASFDLSDLENLGARLDEIHRDFGVPSGILLNGGGPLFGSFDEITLEQWQQYSNQLILANVMVLKKFLPLMAQNSSVVAVLSDVIRNAGAGKVLPCSLRMALLGIIKCLSFEYAEKRIRLNAISPASVETERASALLQKSAQAQGVDIETVHSKFISNLPMKRMGSPEEIAEAAWFLLSNNSSYITGINMLCDGGSTVMPV